MSDYPMLISNKLHSFRNFIIQNYTKSFDFDKRIYQYKRTQNEPRTNPSERNDARGLGNTVPSAPTGGCHVVTGGWKIYYMAK